MNQKEAREKLKKLNKQLEHLKKSYRAGLVNKDELTKGEKRIEKKINKVESDFEKSKLMKEMLKDSPKTRKKKMKKQKKAAIRKKQTKKMKKTDFDSFNDDYDDDKIPWTFVGAAIIIFFIVLIYLKLFTAVPGADTVQIVEFSDFNCEHCAAAQETLKQLEQEYGSQLEFTFKYFPITEEGMLAAQAAECAAFQGMFWEYHDMLFENQEELDEDSLVTYADWLGLDVEDFSTCLELGTTLPAIEADISEAKEKDVIGPPTFFVNGRMIAGAHPLEVFEEVIDQELR